MTNKKVAVISSNSNTYTGHGKSDMDKFNHSNQEQYHFDKQTIIVERNHTGVEPVCEVVKQYVQERMVQIGKLDVSDDERYNKSSNKAVVASTKEGSE